MFKDYPHRETLEKLEALCDRKGNTKAKVDIGYTEEEAELVNAISVAPVAGEIGLALSTGSSKYAALTHASYNALARKARRGEVAPKCYAALTDTQHKFGLGDSDARWLDILKPDETGFLGFTSYAPIVLNEAQASRYSAEGLQNTISRKNKSEGADSTIYSDVVCFESGAPEQGGKVLHSAVDCCGYHMLPPFTLLAVVAVQAAGEWEYLPGQKINQRLITVRPTFLTPAEQGCASIEANKVR